MKIQPNCRSGFAPRLLDSGVERVAPNALSGPGPSIHALGSTPSTSPAAAFTLLELLVATAVSATVLLVINATFFSALRLHNTTHERIDRDLVLQRTLGIVRKDFAGIMLPGGTLAGQLQTTTFSSTTMDSAGERIGPDIYTNSARIDGWTSFYADHVAWLVLPST